MTLAALRFNILQLRTRSELAQQQFDHFQANLVSDALKRMVGDANAAMAHRLSEPLTALMLYLGEIKRTTECSDCAETFPAAVCELVDMALREIERACDIMQLVGQNIERPIDVGSAVARDHEAIDVWPRDSHAEDEDLASPVPDPVNERSLTPRENEVLALIIGGASNKEGGHRLGISVRTFEVHRAHLMRKFGARNAADLIRLSREKFR